MPAGYGIPILLEDGTPLLLEDGTPLLEEWMPAIIVAGFGLGASMTGHPVEQHTEPVLIRFALSASATGFQREIKGTTVSLLFAGPSVYLLHGKKTVQTVVAMAAGPSVAVTALKAVRWTVPTMGSVEAYALGRKEMEVACPVELPIGVLLAPGVKGGSTQSALTQIGLAVAVPVGTKTIPVAVPVAVEIPVAVVTGGMKTQVAAVPVPFGLDASLHASKLEGENNVGAPVLAATAGLLVSIGQGVHAAASAAAVPVGLGATVPAVMGAQGHVAAVVQPLASAIATSSDRRGQVPVDVGLSISIVAGSKAIPVASPTSAVIAVHPEIGANEQRSGKFRAEIAITATATHSRRRLGGARITYGHDAGVRVLVGSG